MTNPSRDQEEEMPESFQPSKYDVIVGWARQNYHHEGNQLLRDIVRDNVPRYVDAKTKHEKGIIIIEILETLKAKSPSGLALLRQNPNTKRWFYIGTDKAKDKIGHALRKASRDMSNGHERSPMRKPKARNSTGAGKNSNSNHCPSPLAVPSLSYRPETSTSATFSLASTQSAFSSSGGMATKSFKTGPHHVGKTSATTTALESWPLTSVTSLSSSESHSEELLQLHNNRQPIQVTVPSSPVTRPSSSASDHNNSTVVSAAPLPPPASHYHHHHSGYHHPPRGVPLETHYEAGAGHGYYGSYHHHHNHHHPQYPYHHPRHHYGKDGYDYHRHHASRSYGVVAAAGDHYAAAESREAAPTVLPPPSYDHDTTRDDRATASAAAAGEYSSQYPASARVHLYDNVEVPPPTATPTADGSSSSFQRVFDEVDRRLQQEEQLQQHAAAAHHGHDSYHHHHPSPQQQRHYYHHPPTHSSSTPEGPYARIVSHEGLATPLGM